MSSIVDVTRVAREIFGLDCTVKYEEKREADGPSHFTSMQVRAVAIKHGTGNPSDEIERIEGAPATFECEKRFLNGQGRAVRERLEPQSLSNLYVALLDRKASKAEPTETPAAS